MSERTELNPEIDICNGKSKDTCKHMI